MWLLWYRDAELHSTVSITLPMQVVMGLLKGFFRFRTEQGLRIGILGSNGLGA